MTEKTSVNTFKIKFINPQMYVCSCHIDNILIHKDFKLIRRKANKYFDALSSEDKDNILVTSNELEPLVFYRDGPLIKCAKTHRPLSCLTCKCEARGGSMVFLSKYDKVNIFFNDELHIGKIIKYDKSPIYPGFGHKGGGFIHNASREPIEKDPLIAYHIDKFDRKGFFIEYEPVGTIDVVLEHPPTESK